MDTVADAVTDLMLSPDPAPALVNVVHPQPVPWTVVLGAIDHALSAQLPLIPYAQWFAKLEAVAAGASSAQLEAVVSPFPILVCGGPSLIYAS